MQVDVKKLGFDPWVGKVPWRRPRQPTPVSLPGESHGQRSLAGYSPLGGRVGHDWRDSTHTRTGGEWAFCFVLRAQSELRNRDTKCGSQRHTLLPTSGRAA